MSDTEKLLAEVEEACAKATPGEWENDWALEPSEGHLVHYVDGQLMPNELPLKHAGNLSLIANARTWLPKLVEIVREQQKEIECEYTLKQAARLEAVTLQKQLEEMRGDLVELLHEIGPCERDEPRDYCFAHGQSACGFEELRAKYLGVKT